MTEEKADYRLALVQNREVTPEVWKLIMAMAPVMHQARLFGVSSPEQAAAIMLKGHELGMGITASFELIQVIQGRPALSPRGALALLHNAPQIKTIKITRLVDSAGKFLGYECFMERVNEFAFTTRFTMEDAKRAGLIKPDSGWANYPENMCMYRTIGFTADVVAPDVCAGLTIGIKAPEMLNVAIDDGGNFVDAKSKNTEMLTPEVAMVPAVDTSIPMMTLEQLLGLFGPDKVLEANGGKFPQSNEELNALGMKLAGGVA